MRLPDGFEARPLGRGRVLFARSDRADAAVHAGLAAPEGWDSLLARPGEENAGRGAVARIDLQGGPRLVLKKLRRGGVLGRFRGDRSFGYRRVLLNLTVPVDAIQRGVSTPQPVLLLLQRAAPGYEAWLAIEEIPGASNLRVRLASGIEDEGELRAAMRAVREMHDAGVRHPDLNLGNLLTRHDSAGWAGFIVDLDRARVGDGAVGLRGREAALRRIERSYEKWFGEKRLLGGDASDVWYRLYSDGDAELSERLARGRAGGRRWLALHRLGWRLSGKH